MSGQGSFFDEGATGTPTSTATQPGTTTTSQTQGGTPTSRQTAAGAPTQTSQAAGTPSASSDIYVESGAFQNIGGVINLVLNRTDNGTVTIPSGIATPVTYRISINNATRVLTLIGSDGSTSTATIPLGTLDTDTTYTIAFNNGTDDLTLTSSDGTTQTVNIARAVEDTTYNISSDGLDLTLTSSEGDTETVTLALPDTAVSTSIGDNNVLVTEVDGVSDTVTLPFSRTDTTYTFSASQDGTELRITDNDSNVQTVSFPNPTGLSEVTTDATLTGAGTTASPLVITNPFTADDETKLDRLNVRDVSVSDGTLTITRDDGTNINFSEDSLTAAERDKLARLRVRDASINGTTVRITLDDDTSFDFDTSGTNGGGTSVVANPGRDAGNDSLTSITIAGTDYNVDGSSSTDVRSRKERALSGLRDNRTTRAFAPQDADGFWTTALYTIDADNTATRTFVYNREGDGELTQDYYQGSFINSFTTGTENALIKDWTYVDPAAGFSGGFTDDGYYFGRITSGTTSGVSFLQGEFIDPNDALEFTQGEFTLPDDIEFTNGEFSGDGITT